MECWSHDAISEVCEPDDCKEMLDTSVELWKPYKVTVLHRAAEADSRISSLLVTAGFS